MSNFARMAKRHSEQLINSVLNLEDLAECIMLTDVNGFIVEFDDPCGQINYVTEIPIRIAYLNGTPFLRGRYIHRNRTINVHAAGDDKENVLFSLTLSGSTRIKHPAAALAGPAAVEKKSSTLPHANEIARMKHKTGVTIYRINRMSRLGGWKVEKDDAYDLQIIRANQATIPFLDMRVEKSCCSALLSWLGLTFHSAQFACYKRDQFIGTVRPKIGLGLAQIGYVVKFQNVPSPAHISKTIVLASTITTLLNLGPINISDDIEEE